MKRRLTHLIKRKSFRQFVLFSVLAFIFLIFSKLSNDYKQSILINLKLNNVSEEVVVKNDTLNQISAYIEAKGFALTPFLFKKALDVEFNAATDFTVTPNLFLFDVQQHKFEIERQIGKSFKVLTLSPDTLLIPYNKMASKMVPVEIKSSVEYDVGYDLKGDLVLSADSVKIVGPADRIDQIKMVITEDLQLTGVRDDINKTIAINTEQLNDIEVFPEYVKVKGDVSRFTEGTLQIPIIITDKPQDLEINFFPKTVTVSFYVDLEQFNTISASDFIVECVFTHGETNSNYLVPKITKQPAVIKWAKIKENRIDFIRL
jgi:hypothetical protein